MRRILLSTLTWIIAFNLLSVLRFFGQEHWAGNELGFFVGATVAGAIVGIVYGITDRIFQHSPLKKKSFIHFFVYKTSTFIIAVLFAVPSTILAVEGFFGTLPGTNSTLPVTEAYLSPITALFVTYAMFLSILFYYNKQIYRKITPGTIANILLGKYHRPTEEERIFMFLDMAASTTIAEKMDSFTFSSLLQDFFADLDEPIQQTRGMTFQFVGDEVVIVWKLKDGIRNNNCIKFFFMAQKKIQREKQKYIRKYGVVPEFKAGMHFGKIIITKVGESKEEFAYHGDTINTAARIRSECNGTDKRILISAELLSILKNLDEGYAIESQGVFSLKGKKNVVGLVSVEEKS